MDSRLEYLKLLEEWSLILKVCEEDDLDAMDEAALEHQFQRAMSTKVAMKDMEAQFASE